MNHYRKKYQEFANSEGRYDHGVLYKMVRDLRSVVAKQLEKHPRTKGKDLKEDRFGSKRLVQRVSARR